MFIVFNSLKNIKIKIKRHIYLNLRNDNCGHLCILLLDNLTKDNVYSFQLFKNIKIKIKRHIYLNLRNDNCGHLCILLLDNLTKDNVYSFQLFKNIKIKIKRHIYLNLRNDNCGHLCILLLDNLTNIRLVKSRTIHISLHDEWINEKYKQLLNFFLGNPTEYRCFLPPKKGLSVVNSRTRPS